VVTITEEAALVEQDKSREDDWFLRNERQLLEQARVAREKREKERAEKEKAEERQRLKEQHFMRCPKCGHEMAEEKLGAISVDRCGFCEGIFFDAGELEQLLSKKDSEARGFFRKLIKI
jgi:RNA polymerase-binding transcription factor DksA